MTASRPAGVTVPTLVRLKMLARLLIVQGSWNYETMLGTGLAFSVEPALRLLPGGEGGEQYRAALARQSTYFNAHPYLAAIAAGALVNAELSGEPPERITRFRTALSGPLGSIGDQLVWAALLPTCSLLALLLFGLGAGWITVVVVFLSLYNSAHIFLRVWGLNAGLRLGLGVSQVLGGELMRRSPSYILRTAAVLSGITIPVVVHRLLGGSAQVTSIALLAAAALAAAIVLLGRRAQGWRVALAVLTGCALYAAVS